MVHILADHSGQGGNWWTHVAIAEAALRAGGDVSLLAPAGWERIATDAVAARVQLGMRWRREPRVAIQACYAQNEITARRMVSDDGYVLLSLMQYGLVSHPRLIQYVHNPVARAVAGSQRVGKALQAYTTWRSQGKARHAAEFGHDDGWFTWPHPVAPASFRPRPMSAPWAKSFPPRAAALVFGRAASTECLGTVSEWFLDLSPRHREALHLIVSRDSLDDRASTIVGGMKRAGVAVTIVPRFASDELDAVVRLASMVLLPYETHPASVSGVGIIATANGTPIVAGSAIDPGLACPPLALSGRGAQGIRNLLENYGPATEPIDIGELRSWGERWLSLLAN